LHQFILSIRRQLQGTSVTVVELYPPAVQTELHDEVHQPTVKNGHLIGIPLSEFMETAWKGIVAGNEDIPVGGPVSHMLAKVDGPRKEFFANMPWNPDEFKL
jgi:short-subunit dehydrogenase involved in D-alanine esterification of teichoic acids